MSMEETPYKSFETITKQFQKKTCKEGMDVVQHTKMMPECRNVTKQNCITKWETDENGNQASDTFFFLLTKIFSFFFGRGLLTSRNPMLTQQLTVVKPLNTSVVNSIQLGFE